MALVIFWPEVTMFVLFLHRFSTFTYTVHFLFRYRYCYRLDSFPTFPVSTSISFTFPQAAPPSVSPLSRAASRFLVGGAQKSGKRAKKQVNTTDGGDAAMSSRFDATLLLDIRYSWIPSFVPARYPPNPKPRICSEFPIHLRGSYSCLAPLALLAVRV